jgi:hypothetical protein
MLIRQQLLLAAAGAAATVADSHCQPGVSAGLLHGAQVLHWGFERPVAAMWQQFDAIDQSVMPSWQRLLAATPQARRARRPHMHAWQAAGMAVK